MLTLPKKTIKKIEGLLEPGYFVHLEQVGDDLQIWKRPKEEGYLYGIPTQVTWEESAVANLNIKKVGEDPVQVASLPVPPYFCFLAIYGGSMAPSDEAPGDTNPLNQVPPSKESA